MRLLPHQVLPLNLAVVAIPIGLIVAEDISATMVGSSCGRRSYTPRCQICKTKGHTTNHCRNRYDRADAHLSEAFTTACSIFTKAESNWYMDTGASAHMIPHLGKLDKPKPYSSKDHVLVGNGASLSITHTSSASPSQNIQLLDVFVVP